MRTLFLFILGLWVFPVLAVNCDCEVVIYPPLTGSHKIGPSTLKTYELEEFNGYAVKNQWECRKLCLDQFHEDIPTERLNALLTLYSQRLVEDKKVGFSCTSPTTFKYPVRVRASLGSLGLGNVADQIQVVTHEEACF